MVSTTSLALVGERRCDFVVTVVLKLEHIHTIDTDLLISRDEGCVLGFTNSTLPRLADKRVADLYDVWCINYKIGLASTTNYSIGFALARQSSLLPIRRLLGVVSLAM